MNKRNVTMCGLVLAAGFLSPYCLAAIAPSPVPSAVASGYPVVVVPADVAISGVDFLTQVFNWMRTMGGVSFCLKLSGAIALLISSMKVSFCQPLWNKLGNYKSLAAPTLSLLAGLIMLSVNKQLTMAALTAYLFSGSGAIILHEIMDSVKAIPGINSIYLSVISVIENILGAPSGTQAASTPSTSGTQASS